MNEMIVLENNMIDNLKDYYDCIEKLDAIKHLKKFYGHIPGWLGRAVSAYNKCDF